MLAESEKVWKMSETKWICEYCTYENWPSSVKCTMCRGAKPLLAEDIYRLRDPSPQRCESSVASGPVQASHNYSQNVPSAGKWSCETCTYLNYQNTPRCTQCGTRKITSQLNQSIHSVASNLHEHLTPLRLGDPAPNIGSNSVGWGEEERVLGNLAKLRRDINLKNAVSGRFLNLKTWI